MGVKNRKNYIHGESHNFKKYVYKYDSGNVFSKDDLNSRVLKTIHCKHALLLANLICYLYL